MIFGLFKKGRARLCLGLGRAALAGFVWIAGSWKAEKGPGGGVSSGLGVGWGRATGSRLVGRARFRQGRPVLACL
ncbi:hypothetical protein PPACK8108_LOCUS18042 [Phakopsora pachyrhizi]|uniref:Uncharacterized protein n=1 Tax=Phakopsora pachyrhizi TaxID=170000 RepID=A0AAV0BA94_PHAPC|nr:hypothetical protein PPACK8108_LOCUS18042 [Phakopsora pachyrhizi]